MRRNVAESISLITRYTTSGSEAFLDDQMIQDAVLRRLETLADAPRHLSDEIKARPPTIHWPAIYGSRNVTAPGCLALGLDRTWVTVEQYLLV